MESTRTRARINLMASAVNTALTRDLITLECAPARSAAFEYELAGMPVLVHIRDAGFDEVRFNVMCCPIEMGREFIDCALHHELQLNAAICDDCRMSMMSALDLGTGAMVCERCYDIVQEALYRGRRGEWTRH